MEWLIVFIVLAVFVPEFALGLPMLLCFFIVEAVVRYYKQILLCAVLCALVYYGSWL